MTEQKCPKHNVPLKLRRNVETGELALACPFCDAEQPPKKRHKEDFSKSTARIVKEATEAE
jgi:uncharacterized Zn finger protein (UPF0148 family)